MDVTWSRPAQFPLVILPLGEDAVAYHSGSGATHRLDELSLAVLGALSDQPCDLATLTARVAERTGIGDDPDLGPAIELRLSELVRHAIVRHHSHR